MRRLAIALVGVVTLLFVGAGAFVAYAAPGRTAALGGPRVQRTADPITVRITESRYGHVVAATAPRAACTLRVEVDGGEFGDAPAGTITATADAAGSVSWTYPTPVVPVGRGRHTVSCSPATQSASAAADFDVPARPVDPAGFTVRIQRVDPVSGLVGVDTRLDPSLAPARDAAAADLEAHLAGAWARATRGLGQLAIVSASADIVVYLLPGRGTSLHERADDGTQRVLLYVSDETGRPWAQGGMTRALHELGHLWCCHGEDATPDGHWRDAVADPQLEGVDQYGLMTHPVVCLARPGVFVCPSAFSERELREMGFPVIPSAAPDTCAADARALRARQASLDASLDASSAALDASRLQLESLADQVHAMERTNPLGQMSEATHATYLALIDRYGHGAADFEARRAAHNDQVQERNDLAHEINALPC